MGQAVDPAAHQHGVHRLGRGTELAGDLHRPEPLVPPQVHDLRVNCSAVLVGLWCGREERSTIPAMPSVR